MNILLTNDDGYEAPGLHAAYEAVRHLGPTFVVAPKTECSSCSHAITTGRPINVNVRAHPHFGTVYVVEGMPADCVRIALGGLLEHPIDLVVSGVNRGANAGVDVYYSGTVAAAREAALLNRRAVAVSQATRAGVDPDWPAVSAITGTLIDQLIHEELPGPGFWTINYPAPLPDGPEDHVHRVQVASRAWPIHFERDDSEDGRAMRFQYAVPYWQRDVTEPSDYSVVRDGGIAVCTVPLFCRF